MEREWNALLSIKPKYANQILDGDKKVEFRKSVFKNKVERVYIYSSSPQKCLIGYFTIKGIDRDTPETLWTKYKDVGGIEKTDFFEYYSDKEFGYSILIDEVVRFIEPIAPQKIFKNFVAPQSFQYIHDQIQSFVK